MQYKHDQNRIRELLKALTRGQLNDQDHAYLQKVAKTDPFVADAIEGYAAFPEQSAHIQDIRKTVQDSMNKSRPKRILPAWIRVAAILLVVIGGVWITWNVFTPSEITIATLSDHEGPEQLMKSAEKSDDIVALKEDQAATLLLNRTQDANVESGKNIEEESLKITFQSEMEPGIQSDNKASVSPKEIVEEELIPEEKPQPQLSLENYARITDPAQGIQEKQTEVRSQSRAFDAAVMPAPIATENQSVPAYVTGMIKDQESGEPLIGANVLIKGTEIGTTTDLDGKYQIPLDQDSSTLRIDYIGYNSIEQVATKNETLDFSLSGGIALDEVVVTDPGARKSKREARENSALMLSEDDDVTPAPKIGYDKYEKYIRQNLKYPEPAKTAGISGSVIIAFQLDKKGRPADLKVKKSIGYGCDEEALRLIREGPRWKVSGEGYAAPVEYEIQFKLK